MRAPGVFSESVAATDPAPCSVAEFPSAAARLVAFPEPHYILFTADPDAQTGGKHALLVASLVCMLRPSTWVACPAKGRMHARAAITFKVTK